MQFLIPRFKKRQNNTAFKLGYNIIRYEKFLEQT
jgi:hypothetical protein